MVASKKQDQKSKRQLVKDALDAALAGSWDEAIAINEAIIARFPRDAEAMNRKGRALIELRQLAAAREAYSDALKADPANMIARRNLQRLETLHNRPEGDADGTTAQASIPRANVFIEEIGKTWVDELANPADIGQLAEIAPGSLLNIELKDGHLVVSAPSGARLGEIDDMTAQRIMGLIAGGNRYEVYALGVSGQSLRVILREVYKDPSQGSRLSFPNKSSSRTSQLMRERELLFQREESDFLFGDEDDDEGGSDETEALRPDDDEDEEVEIDREAEAYVDESLTDDDEENAM
jgi:hypothetical protein